MTWLFKYIGRRLVKYYSKGQATFCFCPGCGLELCNSKSWFSDSDLVRYRCIQCGNDSAWLFDAPCPILIEHENKRFLIVSGSAAVR
jgi:hypothetical protein